MIARLFVLSAAALVSVLTAHVFAADVASVECTIKSVEPTTRSITVTYKVGTEEKSITLDVSRKAKINIKGEEATLDALTPGDKATVEYSKELEIVTKIDAAGELVDGWRFVDLEGKGDCDPETAFIVARDGTLICTQEAGGWYLITNRRYSAMVFTVEYRYPKAERTGGAIVVGTPGPSEGTKGMPFGFEIKLAPNRCGEMELPRADYRVELPLGQIRDGRRVTRTRQKEPTAGQWNQLEIECNSEHGNVVVKLNGEVVNAVAKADSVAGKIVIWPMKSEIHFRNPTVSIGDKEEKLDFNVTVTKGE